jgi:hypothetical protein
MVNKFLLKFFELEFVFRCEGDSECVWRKISAALSGSMNKLCG